MYASNGLMHTNTGWADCQTMQAHDHDLSDAHNNNDAHKVQVGGPREYGSGSRRYRGKNFRADDYTLFAGSTSTGGICTVYLGAKSDNFGR